MDYSFGIRRFLKNIRAHWLHVYHSKNICVWSLGHLLVICLVIVWKLLGHFWESSRCIGGAEKVIEGYFCKKTDRMLFNFVLIVLVDPESIQESSGWDHF